MARCHRCQLAVGGPQSLGVAVAKGQNDRPGAQDREECRCYHGQAWAGAIGMDGASRGAATSMVALRISQRPAMTKPMSSAGMIG